MGYGRIHHRETIRGTATRSRFSPSWNGQRRQFKLGTCRGMASFLSNAPGKLTKVLFCFIGYTDAGGARSAAGGRDILRSDRLAVRNEDGP